MLKVIQYLKDYGLSVPFCGGRFGLSFSKYLGVRFIRRW